MAICIRLRGRLFPGHDQIQGTHGVVGRLPDLRGAARALVPYPSCSKIAATYGRAT
jgi:hypothetical protein